MSIQAKIGAALATGTFMIASLAGSAFAATTVTVSGNGAFSHNSVDVNQTHRTTITQHNNADIRNSVRIHSNTGYNNANFNTGGDVYVRTGNINNSVRIHNVANVNGVLGNRSDRDGYLIVYVNNPDRDRYIHIRGDLYFDRVLRIFVHCRHTW